MARSTISTQTPFVRTALCAVLLSLLAACGSGKITADTTCRDYLQHPGQERSDAAIRLSAELHAQDAGNPMWATNLDYNCGQNPGQTVRHAFGK